MPDWQELVRDRLSRLDLDATEREEICVELASHLEDDYQHSLAAGASETVALQDALRKVQNWRDLERKIESSRKKEPPMNKRVSQFWFPSFVTLFLAMVLLALIQWIGPNPWLIDPMPHGRLRMTPIAVVYLSWLPTLPFIGALGAYLSRRAGGSARSMLLSALFPIFPYLAFFTIGFPIAIILDHRVAHNVTIPALLVGSSAWVIFPGCALLAGGWLVAYFSERLSVRRIANG